MHYRKRVEINYNNKLDHWGTEVLRWRIREPIILVRDAVDLNKYMLM